MMIHLILILKIIINKIIFFFIIPIIIKYLLSLNFIKAIFHSNLNYFNYNLIIQIFKVMIYRKNFNAEINIIIIFIIFKIFQKINHLFSHFNHRISNFHFNLLGNYLTSFFLTITNIININYLNQILVIMITITLY